MRYSKYQMCKTDYWKNTRTGNHTDLEFIEISSLSCWFCSSGCYEVEAARREAETDNPENLRMIASSIACLLEHGFCSLVVYLYGLLACPWVRCSCGTESAFVFRFRHFSQRLDHNM